MIKLLQKINVVEAGLIGIYLSIIPCCYVMVKIVESNTGIGELLSLYIFWSMMSAPVMGLMFFCHLANQMKTSENE